MRLPVDRITHLAQARTGLEPEYGLFHAGDNSGYALYRIHRTKAFQPFFSGGLTVLHSLCGNAILVMIPFSRFGHWILYPLLWIASATAWKLPSGTQSEETKTEIG